MTTKDGRPGRRLRDGFAAMIILAMAVPVAATGQTKDEPPAQLMFVQTAQSFEADPDAKLLRLVKVNPQTLYFSDRPVRIAGHVLMPAYLDEWKVGKDNFGEDPPNATLSVYEAAEAENSTVVVELLDPVVEGDDIVYRYVLIDGEMPKSGGAAALFIDWIGAGGGVGVGFHGVGVGRRGPGVTGWAGVAVRTDCRAVRC